MSSFRATSGTSRSRGVRYAMAKPPVRGIERNRAGEQVLEGNIYNDMLTHLYMVERA